MSDNQETAPASPISAIDFVNQLLDRCQSIEHDTQRGFETFELIDTGSGATLTIVARKQFGHWQVSGFSAS